VPDGQQLFLFRGGPFYVVQRAAGFIGPRGEMLTGARRSSSSPPGFRSSCWRRSRASRSIPRRRSRCSSTWVCTPRGHPAPQAAGTAGQGAAL